MPRRNVDRPAVVIELKWNKSAESGLAQIKEKRYAEALREYVGDVVLVGVNYDKDAKEHECVIERMEYEPNHPYAKLSTRQRKIVEWIKEHPKTTYDEMADQFGVSRQTIYKDIKKLKEGLITSEGKTFCVTWRVLD